MPSHTISLLSPSGRVKLIPPTKNDDEAVSIIRSHPVTRFYLRFFPEIFTVEDARERRETRAEDSKLIDFHIHAIMDDERFHFSGTTGIFNIDLANETCEAGILVSPDTHGKGIATEALYTLLQYVFEERNFHRVTFETASDNIGMRKWLEDTAGARLEAVRKEAWKESEGKYCDVNGYSILNWEWNSHVKLALEKKFIRAS
ncbi:acyl-CoA N-acyltransferase [Crucibulum laeve]|uniref:Acyl-CoA N-acyltransferase n=1 Tax=Crucibulum laeve TaxID=68775 RepID=A0A5C3MAP3_9AGAR|nr:acyl-CoA N-acyltransferase [Crucibulum laeve]